MKNRFKQEKGVSMIALVITIIILIILTNILVYNAQDSLYIKKLNNMYNDLEILREKVSQYYNEYGKIPAKIKYTNINKLKEAKVISETNDIGDFYVIDLEAMQGITLNYGKDYDNVKNNEGNADNYENLYIINENSHNIFYVQGVKIKENKTEKTYYTDYVKPDETTIDIRYIDGKLIPEGYYYIGKTKVDNVDSIVISTNKEEKPENETINQYKWIKQVSDLENLPSGITLVEGQTEEEFLTSVNKYEGYFKNIEGKVQYIKIDENSWSESYTTGCEYKDKNGDTAYIPKGFKISMSPTMNTIENGLVVQDENKNEYVWIEVPKEITDYCENDDEIENSLKKYTSEYRKSEYEDKWYNGCGLTKQNYDKLKSKMLNSIIEHGGFYIGRYETGIEDSYRTSSGETTQTAVIKKDSYPYNFVTCEQSQKLSGQIVTSDEYTGSLMFGIQWDLVCKFIEENGKNPGTSTNSIKEAIITNSSEWGNYSKVLLNTGASDYAKMLNIYDFAGNEIEWTLECGNDNTCISRGGNYSNEGLDFPANSRVKNQIGYNTRETGFRITLY